jgi:hypothetical protein
MDELDFASCSPESWLDAIPPYLAPTISELLTSNPPEGVAEILLSKGGAENNSILGSHPVGSGLYQNVLRELTNLICGDNEYSAIRNEAAKVWNDRKSTIVAVFAGAIGAKIGLAAAAIAPSVALLLSMVTKIGVNAWCASRR